MSYIAGKAKMSQMGLSVGEEAAAQATMTQRDNNEIIHTVGSTKDILAHRRHMGIVAHSHCQANTVAQQGSQRDNAFPRHVGSILNTPRHVVGTGNTDTYRADGLIASVGLGQHDDALAQGFGIVIDERIVRRRQIVLGQDSTT